MKYFIITGEASGDLHASNLMRGLLRQDSNAHFCFLGGDLMRSVFDGQLMHYRETSYMMLDILLHLGKILKRMRQVKAEIKTYQPDVLILVDYPGFNLRIARFAKTLGLKVFYYISPKVWAWKQGRVKALQKYTSRLFVIFPFEVDFFRKLNLEVEYFGNPLIDHFHQFMEQFRGVDSWKKEQDLDNRPVVALLAII